MNYLEKLIDIHFNGQIKIGSSERIQKEEYDIQYSRRINDYYWNYVFLKKADIDLKTVWQKIKRDMESLNRQPVLYLMSNVEHPEIEQQLEACHLEQIYTDVWMTVEDLEHFENDESKIDIEISQVKDEEKELFIQAVMDGFSSDDPNDPYGTLPEEYRSIYYLEFTDKTYHKLEYCGKYQGKMIATANVWYKGDTAIIYTVSTHKKYQKQGTCKKLMSYLLKDLSKLGIKTACVQTEKGFYTEQVYKNMGFYEVMLGKVYGEKGK